MCARGFFFLSFSPSHADRLMNDRVPPKRKAALDCCTCSGLYQTTISGFVTYPPPPLPFAPPPIFISIIKNQLVFFFLFSRSLFFSFSSQLPMPTTTTTKAEFKKKRKKKKKKNKEMKRKNKINGGESVPVVTV